MPELHAVRAAEARFVDLPDCGAGLGRATLPMAMPQRFTRLILMNTALGCGEGSPSPGFDQWRAFMAKQSDPAVGAIVQRAVPNQSDDEKRAYDAPYPRREFQSWRASLPGSGAD
jgi:haloalkane dehalogenase